MEPAILGVVVDSSVLIAAERRKLKPAEAIQNVAKQVGSVPIVLSAMTIA